MKLTNKKRNVRMLRNFDKHFKFNDGVAMVNRAAVMIAPTCPDEYKSILLRSIQYGWLEAVAYMSEEEMIFAGLTN